MKEVAKSMLKGSKYENFNCFLFAIICHAMEEGCLMDKYQRKAFTLESLVDDVCAVSSLQGKPKVILIEEYGSGRCNLIVR